jgi:hypothetical protein
MHQNSCRHDGGTTTHACKGLAQPCARQVTGALCAVWALSAYTCMAIDSMVRCLPTNRCTDKHMESRDRHQDVSNQNSSQEKRAHAQIHKSTQTYTITYTCIHTQTPTYICAHAGYISANTQMVRPVPLAAVLSAYGPYQARVDRVELNWSSSCVFCGKW